jgi:tetratricopeptide (TPR) repeat protein
MELPFDTSFSFDESLHEVPTSPAEMQQAIRYLTQRLATIPEQSQQAITMLGMIGSYARIVRDFIQAEHALGQAIEQSAQCDDPTLHFINQLRLAHVYQWQGQYTRSTPFFEALLQRCQHDPRLAAYRDFAYQHAGKNRFDQGDYHGALDYFLHALALREDKGDVALLESTRYAVMVTQQKLAAQGHK